MCRQRRSSGSSDRHVGWLITLGTLFLAAAAGAEDGQVRPLFSRETLREDRLTEQQKLALSTLRATPTTGAMRIARAELTLLQTESVLLNLFPGKDVVAVRERIDLLDDQDAFVWFGSIPGKMPGSVILVVRRGNVTGTIRPNGELYIVRPVGEGLQAVIRVDESQLGPDEPPDFNDQVLKDRPWPKMGNRSWAEGSPRRGGTTQSLLVVYTPAAAAAAGDIVSLIDLGVAETNTSYLNSDVSVDGVPLELELAYTSEVAYVESGSIGSDREALMNPSDGSMDEVHDLRDEYLADAVLLLVNAGSGIASAILADPNRAFGVVNQSYVSPNYTFAHELGHLQGARHNPEVDPSIAPFPHGHGYRYAAGGWRTIMSYPCDPGTPCTRVLYWSNPDILYGGVSMGTVETNDNARVLGETAHILSNFRGTDVALHDFAMPLAGATFGVYSPPAEEYKATNSITAGPALTVADDASVIFWSGNEITLNPGFAAEAGSVFQAIIDPTLGSAGELALTLGRREEQGESAAAIPAECSLSQNHPNPCNPATTIRYGLREGADVTLKVYDMLGRLVRTLADEPQAAGYREVVWDGKDSNGATAASGVYIYRLQAGSFAAARKMTLLK